MLPSEFLSRLSQLDLPNAYFGKRPTTFRANTLKISPDKLFSQLENLGFNCLRVPWYKDACKLESKDLRALTDTEEYKAGLLYVQSLSSMIPPLILAPMPGEKILDLTAAPGSKTTQIAALINNTGSIVANDSSRIRSYRLKGNLDIQGVTNAVCTQLDARSIWKDYPQYFDKVLADVPCSMEGRFNETDPKTYQDWSLKKVKELSHIQRWILRSAISATKVGGCIVYSTCTLSPEENEEVIDWILAKEKGKIRLEKIDLAIEETNPPKLHWGTKSFDPSIASSMRITPTPHMEGFYVAKIRKIKSTV
jgi:NOL1/NOP2/sun family putative RNA methylase